MTKICIKPISDSKAIIIDCDTGKEIDICSLCGTTVKTRKKRAPSAYNIFIGKCVKSKSGPIQDRFRQCSTEWKERK